MVARVLIVVPQTVHVLVPALAVTDTTSERLEPSLCLPFDFTHLALRDALIFLPGSFPRGTLASQERLYLLEILWGGKVAATVCHVVLEAVGLLVTLVAIRLRAAEWLR
jgi:hypothetical protein